MAFPTCVKCGLTVFELSEYIPTGSRFKFYFIHCSGCGGVVGVTEFYHVGTRLAKIQQLVTAIAKRLGIS
jgi:predicted nucleic-acid-binding Zn-ribbon protein